ncbi:hypothetical protein [Geobacillus vulcani]|uniref:hypothetical protein n=1 Tax=Geobacillus vulcani TaxID=135517 RepID=UPI000B02DCF1|nr:hypothetical protein [Geobacillus vulcani]
MAHPFGKDTFTLLFVIAALIPRHVTEKVKKQLHEPAIWYAAAQNVAASNMTMASPARIALVASTLGRPGGEGEAMRLVGPIAGAARW